MKVVVLLMFASLIVQAKDDQVRNRNSSTHTAFKPYEQLVKCNHQIVFGDTKLGTESQINCFYSSFIISEKTELRRKSFYEMSDDKIMEYPLQDVKKELLKDNKTWSYYIKIKDRKIDMTIQDTAQYRENHRFRCDPFIHNFTNKTFSDVKGIEKNDPDTVETVSSALRFSITDNVIYTFLSMWKEKPEERVETEKHFEKIVCDCSKATVLDDLSITLLKSLIIKNHNNTFSDGEMNKLRKFADQLRSCQKPTS